MKACSKCGVVKPMRVNSSAKSGFGNCCQDCYDAGRRAYYAANREVVRARQAQYYLANADKVKAGVAAYRTANAEATKVRNAAYRERKRTAEAARRAAEHAAWKASPEYSQWVAQKPERARLRAAAWYSTNPGRALESARRRRELNPGLFAHYSRTYELRKRQAVPAWANLEVVAAYYILAAAMTEASGVRHEVDHIEPLQGKHVCGLHCEFNLQVLPAKVNRAKSNRPSDVVGLR